MESMKMYRLINDVTQAIVRPVALQHEAKISLEF